MASAAATDARRRVRAIAASRPELDARVGDRPGVIGSMLGVKVRDGIVTGEVGLTYFVREKIPKRRLSARQRVPSRLRTEHGFVSTDVLVWPQMVEQQAAAPVTLTDGRHQGTLSCFAASDLGIFGVSCAHCLTGVDKDPATPARIAHFNRQHMDWSPAGDTIYLAYSAGRGIATEFGYLDCGLFDLGDGHLAQRAARAKPARVVADLRLLVGRDLFGMSTLSPGGAFEPVRRARVLGVEAHALGELCDMVMAVEEPGTFRGDSGMAWLTKDGRLAGIHARGEDSPGGSRLTSAMSARRAAKWLDVDLLLEGL